LAGERKALFWSAVINGLCAGPIMVLVMLMTTNSKLTRGLAFPKPQWVIGWISTGVMLTVAAGTMGVFFHKPRGGRAPS
jgi:Mn2+/Fe2+ NRAMP family transporter